MEEAHPKERETFAHQTAVRGGGREGEFGDYDDDTGNGSHGEDDVLIKRMISTHPLYGELVRIHLDCLKIGVAGETSAGHDHLRIQQQDIDYNKSSLRMVHQSDLDQFMEAYCMTLSKLRKAMEEPQQESMAFISSMHSQLQKMKGIPIAHSNASPPPSSPGKLINESF